MIDIWSIVQWWDDWQLRVLVLGSLTLQWFLLLAAPMRKYTVPHAFRTCIWLAYISSDALAIYALATLFNRHARTVPATYCPAPPASKEQSSILEVLWAPILLIHLGGQEEMTAYEIEDNELWMRHTVTLVSQVTVALYAFYKSWHPSSSDWKLTAAAVLLFVIGVISFTEKPVALSRAKIKRLADVSAWIQGTKKPSSWREGLSHFSLFEESDCCALLPSLSTGFAAAFAWPWWPCGGGSSSRQKKGVALSHGDKVLMVLSDMSLRAAAKELVARKRAETEDEVLQPLLVAQRHLKRWLRGAFAFVYTRASVVVTPLYLVYHLALVPVLHVAALALFATSDKHRYKRADVKITYVVLCLTAALDFLAVFVRQLVYRLMAVTEVPALCETVPGYNLIDEAVWEAQKGIGWVYKCARRVGVSCKREHYSVCGRHPHAALYKQVIENVLPELVVDTMDRDLASYRVFGDFDSSSSADAGSDTKNWVLSKKLQASCGEEIRSSLGFPFDRSVLLWHIATDLCFRCSNVVMYDEEEEEEEEEEKQQQQPPQPQQQYVQEEGEGGVDDEIDAEAAEGAQQGRRKRMEDPAILRLHIKCARAISDYMAHLLNSNPEMLLTGSRHHLISEAIEEVKSAFGSGIASSDGCFCKCSCNRTGCGCSCGQLKRAHHHFCQNDQLRVLISRTAHLTVDPAKDKQVFHIIDACKLASELLEIPDDATRWMVMYKVWLGMLCYSASMCRGYLHAKSLGEGGEFLSYVWLVLSLKGAKTLADKLQIPLETSATTPASSTATTQAPEF